MRIRLLIPLFTIALLFSCDYDRNDAPVPVTDIPPAANISIAELWDAYSDGGVEVAGNLVIAGTVTSNDSCGNFYKCAMIQDETGAVELRLGLYDIYTMFRPDERVHVSLRGLALGKYQGMLQVGTKSPAGSAYEVEYINSVPIISQHIFRGGAGTAEPLAVTIPELNAGHLGKLVEITGAAFTQGGVQTWSGEKTFSEKRGVSVIVYTAPYATFADDMLPEGKIRLRGIVTQYRDKLQIKVSSADDAIPDPD